MRLPREARPFATNPSLGQDQTLPANGPRLRARAVNFDEHRVSALLYPTLGRDIQATPRSVQDLGVGTNDAVRRQRGCGEV